VRISNATQVAPNLAMTHDILSERELLQGVNAVHVPVGLEKVQSTHDNNGGPKLETYMALATRHHFDVMRGAMRHVELNCVFLPYLAPGFPCLVEDPTGPYFGIVARVQHNLPATGQPTTSVTISHVREAYEIKDVNRNAPPPRWLNARFLPSQIDTTYKKLFGENAYQTFGTFHAAMVPASQITVDNKDPNQNDVVDYYAVEQTNLDHLARLVVPTPLYSKDLDIIDDTSQTPTAELLRASGDTQAAMQRYQFRPGVSLSQFLLFHHLPVQVPENIDDSSSTPPADLAPVAGAEGGHPLYGNPFGLKLVGENTAAANPASVYGVYELVPASAQSRVGGGTLISDLRQRASRTIKARIDLGITKDT
jgi:hypothetical protein